MEHNDTNEKPINHSPQRSKCVSAVRYGNYDEARLQRDIQREENKTSGQFSKIKVVRRKPEGQKEFFQLKHFVLLKPVQEATKEE